MIDQTKITAFLAEKIGQQLANAQNATQRNEILKDAMDSDMVDHLQQVADGDRIHDKLQSVVNNPEIRDRIQISERAETLYRLREAQLEQAPARVHEHLRTDGSGEPFEGKGSLGNMDSDT
ncbi:hypothetical protein CEE37_03395 [candidate division LCP-89 bacterium B3_LCP]|uniref:Uncharacterized protein n=1 Tax=candidate division LCP-89 bacterium B3_LCP TaxID=2012998 RepID=A0A532V332_UNCL8|nr:MAG: hypothetical protein CEE37_03395 [candidate division LCP-89 bacterium B3_LCP]